MTKQGKMKYKDLTAYEKLIQIQEINFCRAERHNVAVYLNALRMNDKSIIEDYERFGESPRQLLTNKRTYNQGLLFGFTDVRFNKYGWLDNSVFQEVEEFGFINKKGWAAHNGVTIGKGKNRIWTYGVDCSTGGAGYYYGISIWGKQFNNRKECLKAALKELLDRHHESSIRMKNDSANFSSTYSNAIVKQVEELYDTLTGRRATQLTLIFE